MKKILYILILLTVSPLAFSQAQKIGYVFEDYILTNFSEVKALQAEADTKKKGFETEILNRAKTYQEKYEAYQASLKNIANITTESLNAALKEVQTLKKDNDDYQASAETELRTLLNTKFAVIRGKVDDAIKKTAAEKGYKFIFRRNVDYGNRESSPFMLYSNDNGRDNLSDAVLLKLGNTPPKAAVPPKPAPKSTTAKSPAPKK